VREGVGVEVADGLSRQAGSGKNALPASSLIRCF
jgi:hypothetical protein